MKSVRAIGPWVLLAAAALLPYLNALSCGFAYDDEGVVLTNPYVQPAAPWWQPLVRPFWPPPMQAGLYRPVTSLSYRWQLGWHGPDPTAFHAFNVLAHLGVVLLAFATLRRLFPRHPGWALATGLLFATHALHTEAVTGIVGRSELLAAFFGLAGYWWWLAPRPPGKRGALRLAGVGLSFALAAGSKESTVGWLLLAGAHRAGWLGDGRGYASLARADRTGLRGAVASDLALVAGIAAYVAVRMSVLGSTVALREVSFVDNPIFTAPLDVRVLTAGKVLGRGLGLMLWPAHLSPDYSFDTIAVVRSWASWAGLLLVALCVAGAFVARRARRWPRIAWGGAAWSALLLPVSNLILPIGTIMGERLLYLPSLGFLALIAAAGDEGLARLSVWSGMRWRWLAAALVLAAAAALGWRTWERNRDWTSTLALFESAERVAPRSVRVLCNLGGSYSRAGRLEEAKAKYQEAYAIAPEYHGARKGLAHALILERQYAEAEALLRGVLAQRPTDLEAHSQLGNLMLEVGRGPEALELFDRLLALDPRSREGLLGRASALFLTKRYAEAADAWERAWNAHGRSPELGRHVAAAQVQAGRASEAVATLREVLTKTPEQADLQGELARLLLEQGERGGEGLEAARAAVRLQPTRWRYELLIEHLAAAGRCGEVPEVLSAPGATGLGAAAVDSLRARARALCPGLD